jgi:23S rRNA (guanine2445-N2)-methyltransferase / 23S rRNA (guanine2069-N7)-methyltransferase
MPQFLALTSPGIEILLAEEITKLGGESVVQKPDGVHFSASLSVGYHICLWTRLATRVLLLLGEGDASNSETLYESAKLIDWPQHFNSTDFFAIDFVGTNQAIRDSQFGALTVKDAVVDRFRDANIERPNIDKHQPDIRFQVRLVKQQAYFYLDFSGRSLFQRGYRQHSGSAPLKEHLAAAIVIRSGWLENTEQPLVDPMCGSGTILIEAVSMACGIAPALAREFWGFQVWQGHDEQAWQQQLALAIEQSEQNLQHFNGKVYGFDLDARVLNTAKNNVDKAQLSQFIELKNRDINKLVNTFDQPGVMLFNPPYGERLGEIPELVATFNQLGQLIKERFANWRVAIFTGNLELLPLLKLASHKRYKFKNGGLDCQLALYDVTEQQLAVKDTASLVEQSAFANRLKKNLKKLKGWLKQQSIDCYRLYDADIPEYNVAIDRYGDYVVIHEYAAPANIPADKTAKRLQEVVLCTPQVLNVPAANVVLKTRAKQKGLSQYTKLNKTEQQIIVKEYGAKFLVNLWDYLDTGLFLDHRKTRQIVAKKAQGKSLLNLFAYTGSVSVQAALHGAKSVTTVDMSKTYLQWAQKNFQLNELHGSQYQFIQADCLEWLRQNQQQFDVVFIDPPTFSNSKRMSATFDVQRDHVELLTLGMKAVAKGGELIFTNNKRHFKMDHAGLAELGFKAIEITPQTRDVDFERNKHIHNSWVITRVS